MRYKLVSSIAGTDIQKGDYCEYQDCGDKVQPFTCGKHAGFATHDVKSGEALILVIKSMFSEHPMPDGSEWEGWIPPGGDPMYFDPKGYKRQIVEEKRAEMKRVQEKRAEDVTWWRI